MISMPERGLYAITDTELCAQLGITTAVRYALQGGAKVIQYRDKTDNHTQRHREASELLRICHDYGAPLIINDDVELAAAVGADGVHIGKDDENLVKARCRLGATAAIGVSCYNSVELALAAQDQGADCVAFGRFFPSQVKPDAPSASIATVRDNRHRIAVPIIAIGGITPENSPPLLQAGVDLLAVISGVFAHADPREAARQFASLFDDNGDS